MIKEIKELLAIYGIEWDKIAQAIKLLKPAIEWERKQKEEVEEENKNLIEEINKKDFEIKEMKKELKSKK